MIGSTDESNKRNSARRLPTAPDAQKSLSDDEKDSPIILEKLEIKTRAVKTTTSGDNDNQPDAEVHMGTSNVGMKKLRDRLNAFNEAGKSNVKKTVDISTVGQRRFSSVKDVVNLINSEKKIISVEEQYQMTKEEQDHQGRVKAAEDERSRSNSVTIKRGDGDITVTLDNGTDDSSDDGDQIQNVASKSPFVSPVSPSTKKYVIDENISSSDLLFGTSTGGSTFLDDDDELAVKEDCLKQEQEKQHFVPDTRVIDECNSSNSINNAQKSSSSSSNYIDDRESLIVANPNSDLSGELKGYLLKKSPNFLVGWQIRYFILKESGDLVYFKKENSPKAQGVIQQKAVLRKKRIDFNRENLRFEILTGGRVYGLMASTEQDAVVWTEALNRRYKIGR